MVEGSHVIITYDALDLTVQGPPSLLASLTLWTWDLCRDPQALPPPAQTWDLPSKHVQLGPWTLDLAHREAHTFSKQTVRILLECFLG